MKLFHSVFFTLLLVFVGVSTWAADKCTPDQDMVRLLKEMSGKGSESQTLLAAVKENPALAKLWKEIGTENLANAWTVLKSDNVLRKDPSNVKKINDFITKAIKKDSEVKNKEQAIKNLAKSFKNQANEVDKKKWIKLKYTKVDLETKYRSMSQDPPPKLTPWTKEHKAQRWANYLDGKKDRGEKSISYVAWSNIYDGNINKTKRADEAVDKYATTTFQRPLTSEEKEVRSAKKYPVVLTHNGRNKEVTGNRRHDILVDKHAYEIKDYRSSRVNLSADIEREVLMDIAMKNEDIVDEVTWVFTRHPDGRGEPSRHLFDLLRANDINVEYRNP